VSTAASVGSSKIGAVGLGARSNLTAVGFFAISNLTAVGFFARSNLGITVGLLDSSFCGSSNPRAAFRIKSPIRIRLSI